MVAAPADRWQAGRVVRRGALAMLGVAVALAAAGVAGTGPGRPAGAQVAPPAPAPRVMTFSWTLYPDMWAEIDLRVGPGGEAVAEVTAEGGEVSWDLHTHPPESAPSASVTIDRGVAGRATVRCAPEAAGWYSYLVRNDRGAAPVRVRIDMRLSGDVRVDAVKP
jgi:hypothetical protein